MTDITELAQSLKAAAENAIGAHERLAAYPYDEIIDISQHEGEQIDIDITDLNEFNKEANPINVIALVEALEKAQQRIDELENDEVRQRLANAEHQLYMAELAKNNLRASRKAQFRKRKAAEQRIAYQREYYEGVIADGGKRIAELESRTVKLPELCVGVVQGGHAVMVPYPAGHWFNKAAILEMLSAAGIKVEDE